MARTNLRKKLIAAALAVLYILAIRKFALLYAADTAYTNSKEQIEEGYPKQALKSAESAIAKNSKEPGYYKGRARTYIVMALNAEKNLKTELKYRALEDLEKALTLNPDNLATVRNIIPLYYFLAVESYQPESKILIDQNYFAVTKDYFETVKQKYPRDAGVLVTLAKYEKNLGMEKEFEETLDMLKTLRPDLIQWHPSLK